MPLTRSQRIVSLRLIADFLSIASRLLSPPLSQASMTNPAALSYNLASAPEAIASSLDLTLLSAARSIYETYCEVQTDIMRQPSGVAIHGATHRGKPVFGRSPILLPGECFIPMKQIDPELF